MISPSRRRAPAPGYERSRHGRNRALLRDAGRLIRVALLAAVVGALLGIGIAVVTGQDKHSSQSSPDAGGPSGAAGRLPTVTVLSAIVHPVTAPAGEPTQRARVSVHARVTNATGRVVTPAQPVLLVGDVRVSPAAGASDSANPLLAPIDPGAVADGRLRFDTDGAITGQLTTASVQVRIVGKTVPLKPKIGYPTAASG